MNSKVRISLIAVTALVSIGIVAMLSFDAYREFALRANMKEVLGIGDQATRAVEEYAAQHNVNPTQMEQTDFSTRSPLVKSVSVNGQTGTVRLIIGFSPMKDKVLLFIPSLDRNKMIVWKCTSENIGMTYLPARCRQ